MFLIWRGDWNSCSLLVIQTLFFYFLIYLIKKSICYLENCIFMLVFIVVRTLDLSTESSRAQILTSWATEYHGSSTTCLYFLIWSGAKSFYYSALDVSKIIEGVSDLPNRFWASELSSPETYCCVYLSFLREPLTSRGDRTRGREVYFDCPCNFSTRKIKTSRQKSSSCPERHFILA